MVAAMAEAVMGPMPGIVTSRRLTVFALCSRMITASKCLDAHLKSAQLREEGFQCLARQSWQISIIGILQRLEQVSNPVPACRRDDAELAEMTADRVDQHGSLANQ